MQRRTGLRRSSLESPQPAMGPWTRSLTMVHQWLSSAVTCATAASAGRSIRTVTRRSNA